jgi:hypothetical protein
MAGAHCSGLSFVQHSRGTLQHPWQHEIAAWRVTVRWRLKRSPLLRSAIEAELVELYEVDGVPRPPLSATWPFTLDSLLERWAVALTE